IAKSEAMPITTIKNTIVMVDEISFCRNSDLLFN
ncbi:MAG: hypothetical protein RJB23_209, partial [Pseudomonadota bacterium]